MIIPVDPFQRYLDDLAKAVRKQTLHRPDLIVVGSHGRTGIQRLMVGSVAAKVVAQATVPVLVAR